MIVFAPNLQQLSSSADDLNIAYWIMQAIFDQLL